jgi:hypothetical protein
LSVSIPASVMAAYAPRPSSGRLPAQQPRRLDPVDQAHESGPAEDRLLRQLVHT